MPDDKKNEVAAILKKMGWTRTAQLRRLDLETGRRRKSRWWNPPVDAAGMPVLTADDSVPASQPQASRL